MPRAKAQPAKKVVAKKQVRKAVAKKPAKKGVAKAVEKKELKEVTRTAIRFLARRAGVKRIDKGVYDYVYEYIQRLVSEVTGRAVIVSEHSNKKTLQQEHLETALRLIGHPVAISCANNIPSLLDKHVNRPAKKRAEGETKAKRHFKQGTVALREIRHEQKRSDCAALRFLPFQRLVRRIVATFNDNMRISHNVFLVLQLYVENRVVAFLSNANLCAVHASRISVQPNDLLLAETIQNCV